MENIDLPERLFGRPLEAQEEEERDKTWRATVKRRDGKLCVVAVTETRTDGGHFHSNCSMYGEAWRPY